MSRFLVSSRTPFGIEDQLAVDGVGDVALERAKGLSLGLALGNLAIEVGPTLGVGLADLGDAAMWMALLSYDYPAVRAGETPDRLRSARSERCPHRRRRSPGWRSADVAGVTDQRAGENRADTEEIGERGLRCPDGGADATVRLFDLLVESAYIIDELEGELVAHVLDRGGRLESSRGADRRQKRRVPWQFRPVRGRPGRCGAGRSAGLASGPDRGCAWPAAA